MKFYVVIFILLMSASAFSQELIIVDCSKESPSGDIVIYDTGKKQDKMKTSEPEIFLLSAPEHFDKKNDYIHNYTHKRAVAPEEIQAIVKEISSDFGIDPEFILAVIEVESGFNPSAVSPAGAIGLMQLMPGTADALGVDPWDIRQNIYGGIKYLRFQLDRFNSTELALAAYNAGPGAIIKYGGIPPYEETKFYVNAVMSIYSSK